MSPVYVDPFLGAGAVWLHLVHPDLVPLVSWMGGKRTLARPILDLLHLTPGRPVPCLLGDASWWGWVWPVALADGRVSEVLRSWRNEDPRALWFRLRDAGPFADPVEAAAQLLWLQARAASGVPVWWEGGAAVQWASTKIDRAGQRQGREPGLTCDHHPPGMSGDKALASRARVGTDRLLASNGHGQQVNAGHKQQRSEGGKVGGIQDPGTIADRLDAVRARLVQRDPGGSTRQNAGKGFNAAGAGGITCPATVAGRLDAIRIAVARAHLPGGVKLLHTDALTLTLEHAARIGARGRVYLDPPYQGCTGYPAECPRSEVLEIADTWARHGALVVLSEAVPLDGDLGRGWRAVQLQAPDKRRRRKAEWVTCFGAEAGAAVGPLFRGVA